MAARKVRRLPPKPAEPGVPTPGDAWDYDRMTTEAASAESVGMFNVEDGSLMAPADMEQAQLDLLKTLDQPKPASRGQLVRCVLESLSLEYAYRLRIETSDFVVQGMSSGWLRFSPSTDCSETPRCSRNSIRPCRRARPPRGGSSSARDPKCP